MLRSLLFTALVSVVLAACSFRSARPTPPCPCAGKSTEHIISELTSLVVGEGMTVTLVNEKVGLLQASLHDSYTWQFLVRNDTVIGRAGFVSRDKDEHGHLTGETTNIEMDDNTLESRTWYWNVRNGLRRYCGVDLLLP